jgi:hypothetical protein
VACAGWFGVGIYGVWLAAASDDDGSWQRPYLLFTISLVLGAALTLVAAWTASRGTERTGWRWCGVGLGALAVLSTMVAWALPLWMALIAASTILLAIAAPRALGSRIAALAAAQLAGIAVLYLGLIAEIGRQDDYGDHPLAFGLSLVVTAVGSVIGLGALATRAPATGLPMSVQTDPMEPASR